MRLWHWKLIQALPREQLLGQWRECCLIAKNIAEEGTPNHILVNRVLEYSQEDFIMYAKKVSKEMQRRGYRVNPEAFWKHLFGKDCAWNKGFAWDDYPIFEGWHNYEYLRECYYNLEEKWHCGGISDKEFKAIRILFEKETEENQNGN